MRLHGYAGCVAALASIFFGLTAATPSVAVAYCASINTASTSANSSTFQSEGLCFDFCNDDGYALGVLQDEDCWCSNYVPATAERVATSKCENSCPGYPSDYCGGDDLYGYIALSAAVSGTAGGTSTTATATSTTKTTSETTTTGKTTTFPAKTVTETIQASVTTSATSSSQTTTSTSLTSSQSVETSAEATTDSSTAASTTDDAATTTSTSKGSPSILTTVQTVTSEGAVTTQTIVTTAWPKSDASGGLSKGAIAGIVLGVLALIAAFIAGALLYRRHKKNQQLQEQQAPLNAAMAGSHRRGSSAGIMSKTGTMSSSGYGLPMDEDMSYASQSRRLSMKPLDPRLDFKQTFGLYRAASHDSINTIRDDQDYSRRVHDAPRIMRVTNPDPDDN